MELESMWVHGIRRFAGAAPVRVRLDSRLVCLVGANEVGKSTLLDALEWGYIEPETDPGDAAPIGQLDRTRGEDVPDDRVVLRLRYRLDRDDLAVLGSLTSAEQLADVRWLERKKLAGGAVTTDLLPVPVRDKQPRGGLATELRDAQSSEEWPTSEDPAAPPVGENIVIEVLDQLSSNYMYLGQQTLERLTGLADYLGESESFGNLARHIRDVVDIERLPHPLDEGRSALSHRVPKFIRFDDQARFLADEYELTDEGQMQGASIRNLTQLARLDVPGLLIRIQSGETGTVKDLIDEANQTLRGVFEAWTQEPPVSVNFDHSGTRLFVHVKSGTGASMRIGERSEGLRQFVALVALTAGQSHDVPPILLIDELEVHLHYDAQADLIRVLAAQDTAAQVIYTTHSFACLPEDLGSSVRIIRGVDATMTSTVEQQFWSTEPGLVPLLLAMGAGSLAFVPLRPAAIVEGGSDLVLLPSLCREATGEDVLGFQVVPGAANVPPVRIAGLDLVGVATVWILDGDPGGRERRDYLTQQGVPADRIVLLEAGESGLELEDLVLPTTYVQAVNGYIRDVGGADQFAVGDLPAETCRRHRALVDWCAAREIPPPGKVAVANKVLHLRREVPLLDPMRRRTLRKIVRTVRHKLDL
jgi:hypothetical protein